MEHENIPEMVHMLVRIVVLEHINDHHQQYIIQIRMRMLVLVVALEATLVVHDYQVVHHVQQRHQVQHEHINEVRVKQAVLQNQEMDIM